MWNYIIRFFLENKLFTFLLLITFVGWGIVTAPFNWDIGLPNDPVPVDAIPDIGENQQIIFTEWKGRSPQDIEDQITYPLTTALLGIPGVKTIRSNSMFGYSSIYVIFEENIEFYWSRSRMLEKLNSLPKGLLPNGVQPSLGPDATALGQVFWYTLEGRDEQGKVTGGWGLEELRSTQDFYVKYALASAKGVSEVASIGGHLREYQIELNPEALKAHHISLAQVVKGVKSSNLDIGAKTLEINQAEYFVRGLGYIQNAKDLEEAVVSVKDEVPLRIRDIATVQIGPATRRGVLDKSGAEVVGGVIIARYGANPLEVINEVKAKIKEIEAGLPSKTLTDGRISRVKIIPFYDRTQLIYETLGTLNEALTLEILITIIVIIVMVQNLRASVLIAGLLPVAVLMTFIAMRYFSVDANIVALSGIAIAIGTMVDVGIVLSENMLKHLEEAPTGQSKLHTIRKSAIEVAPAIVTAMATTVVSFIPVFTMEAAEGKLFRPLAFTKTFALVSAMVVSLVFIPMLAHLLFSFRLTQRKIRLGFALALLLIGGYVLVSWSTLAGIFLLIFALVNLIQVWLAPRYENYFKWGYIGVALLGVTYLLTQNWLPLGANSSFLLNFIFVAGIITLILGLFFLVIRYYPYLLGWCLDHKRAFLLVPTFLLLWGATVWLGFNTVFGKVAQGFDFIGLNVRTTRPWTYLAHQFPGTSKEFMPALDEGAFLLMPTSMPHSGVQYNTQTLQQLDMLVTAIPEVEVVVGKLGRVESALDPAPISMYENVILYRSEFKTNQNGHKIRFKINDKGEFVRNSQNQLIPDSRGKYFRQWREHIKSPDDIWQEIVKVTKIPGVTSAPKLQPIETRLVMLQTGMRAPMGIKVKGPDLKTIESFGLQLEKLLKEVPSVKQEAVFADRIVGKPYLNIRIDRHKIARYGLTIQQVQQYIQVAVGGMPQTMTVEGRERYSVRVRYARELRDDPESLKNILIPTPDGKQIPLGSLTQIEYTQGPQSIKSEDTFLLGYVLFDKKDGYSEVDVVENAQEYIQQQIVQGKLKVPAGVSFKFSGSYENQIRAEKRLVLVVPLCLGVILMLLYFQFKSLTTAFIVFSGIAVAFAGGFIMIWLYGQEWFLNFSLFDNNLRDLFQINSVNLSVAVWVGFIALFGIATDDGVVMTTYLDQNFKKSPPKTKEEVRERVLEAGMRRIRPCLMTTGTTLLALLPILTSSGRGSDIMIPMAIPSFGGMAIELITLFVVPVLYAIWQENKLRTKNSQKDETAT
jgi:Cu(I)/Ag(I) efflux system membrane protein CusA/SilA